MSQRDTASSFSSKVLLSIRAVGSAEETIAGLLIPAASKTQLNAERIAVVSNLFHAKYKLLVPVLPPEYYLAETK